MASTSSSANDKQSTSSNSKETRWTSELCRTCINFSDWARQRQQDRKGAKETKAELPLERPADCPLDSAALGTSSWSLLHTVAANYPDKPSKDTEKDMRQFIDLFAKFYPCNYCRDDFIADIGEKPPKTTSRHALSQWLCRAHNTVNRKMGKAEFDCRLVDERWRDGWKDGRCG